MKHFLRITSLVTSLLFLSSCVETVIVGSTSGGILAAREKSFKNTGKDIVIKTELLSELLVNNLKTPGNSVAVMVNEGRVLLTGIVSKEEEVQLAESLAWKISNVQEVINEIQIRDEKTSQIKKISSATLDYLITAQTHTKLLFSTKISSLNYKITTTNQNVYLLGVAASQKEITNAVSIISRICGVKKVVNHLILSNDNRRQQ